MMICRSHLLNPRSMTRSTDVPCHQVINDFLSRKASLETLLRHQLFLISMTESRTVYHDIICVTHTSLHWLTPLLSLAGPRYWQRNNCLITEYFVYLRYIIPVSASMICLQNGADTTMNQLSSVYAQKWHFINLNSIQYFHFVIS